MVIAGCESSVGSGSDAGRDAGRLVGDDAQVDAFVPLDAPIDAPVTADGGPCADACEADEACVRGVCVPTCGADLGGFDAALSAGLSPVTSYCRTPVAFTVVTSGTERNLYEMSASTDALTTTFTVSRATITEEGGVEGMSTVGTATHTAGMDDMVFAGGYLVVSADESRAAFGYTTTRAGFVGGVFDLATGSGEVSELAAHGNFDATFVDADTVVINGQGLGTHQDGQGLYAFEPGAASSARQLAREMGDFSGGVALYAAHDLVLAGGASLTGSQVFAIPRAMLMEDRATPLALEPTAAIARFDLSSSFTLLSGGRIATVAYTPEYEVAAIEVRALSVAMDGAVTIGAPSQLTTGAVFRAVTPVDDEHVLLSFAGGLLLVRE